MVRNVSHILWKPLSSVGGAPATLGGPGEDGGHVEVGDEELGVGRLQDHGADIVVGGDTAAEGVQLLEQGHGEHVERWGVDGGPTDAVLGPGVEELVRFGRVGGHGVTLAVSLGGVRPVLSPGAVTR